MCACVPLQWAGNLSGARAKYFVAGGMTRNKREMADTFLKCTGRVSTEFASYPVKLIIFGSVTNNGQSDTGGGRPYVFFVFFSPPALPLSLCEDFAADLILLLMEASSANPGCPIMLYFDHGSSEGTSGVI